MTPILALVRFCPGVAFAVEVNSGNIKLHARKSLPDGFVRAVQEQIDRELLNSGVLYGVRQQGGYTVKFAPGFPDRARQPLLNSWHIHKERYGG